MRIHNLTMKNFRGFEDATLDLDRPLTVLCGVNGSGKSSALMACVLVLSEVLRALRWKTLDVHAEDTDIRTGATELLLTANVSNGNSTNRFTVRHVLGARPTMNLSLAHLFAAAPALFVFYDASRNVTTAPDAFSLPENGGAPHPHPEIYDSLAVGQLKFRSLFQWFKVREDVENELKVSKQDLSLEDPQLAAVRRAVTGMLPEFSGLRIQRDPLHMVIRKGSTLLVLDQLSDGERLLLALTADLARRLAITHANRGNPLEGEAVVLIDEIEQHLHAAWQRRVLADLRRTFPNCQFIVTTHSPQVLSEVPNEAVTLVQDFQFFRPAAPTEGRDSSSILWEVLGVPARPQAVVHEIEDISGLLDEGKNDEARERLDRLAQSLTERDPDVARLRRLMDVVERIDASDHEGA